MALLRTYDVDWPNATQQNLSWADFLNVGFSVAAPGCWISGYNFYIFYVVQMGLPVSILAPANSPMPQKKKQSQIAISHQLTKCNQMQCDDIQAYIL